MKIYNKKRFTAGILCALACFAGLCWGVQNNFQAGFGSLFGMGVFLIVGIRMALRSLSREKAKEERVEERDERNLSHIRESGSLAHNATMIAGLAAALILAILSKAAGSRDCASIGFGIFMTVAFGHITQMLILMHLRETL